MTQGVFPIAELGSFIARREKKGAYQFRDEYLGGELDLVLNIVGGGVLEIFAFEPKLPAESIPWHRVGLTHFSFNVTNLQKWHDHLVAKGVEIVSKPEKSPRGHSFFFVRDFDGNLIELMDLGYMYHVLGWLGPLGGWIFRRGMYKQYYT